MSLLTIFFTLIIINNLPSSRSINPSVGGSGSGSVGGSIGGFGSIGDVVIK